MGLLDLWFRSKSDSTPDKCSICGKDIAINENCWKLKDGYMCKKCQKPFAKMNYNSVKSFQSYTSTEIVQLEKELNSLGKENLSPQKREYANLSEQELFDILNFRNLPFSLTGDLLSECGIPYFEPNDKDIERIRSDIRFVIKLAKETGIFKTYRKGNNFEYIQIRADIYTPSKKIKKFPISAYINDGKTFYTFFYDKTGNLSKANLLYTPNNTTGYDIKYKEISGSLVVRKICSYPLNGGPSTEIYRI